MKRIYLYVLGGLGVLAALIFICWTKSQYLQGEVVIRQLNISPRVVGRVKEIAVREGAQVKKGERVAVLFAPDVVAKSVQANAPHELAQKSYARIKELYDGGVVSAQRLDEAKAQVQQARGAASASLTFVDELYLVAPADGEISTVVLEEGELASPGIPLLTLLDTSDVWVTFNVREDLLSSFELNGTVPVIIPALGKEPHPFTVTYISKQGDYAVWSATKTRGEFDLKTFEVRAKPVEPMPRLRQGMTALIQL
ncbi:efflux RND transporter periplasmic adaptor subunit [Candidatus Avelusimicrobium faecicola]|uniref:efflux RND transporter periplasmic adaptor subunit n=1 Tax=Candidatus Avelusimicrobium faecicola TaxID=3416205 RepID=UPI0015A1FC19